MQFPRLAAALPLVLVLAACGGGNPQPPATPTATAPTPTVAAPVVPARPTAPVRAASEEALDPLLGNWAADLGNCGSDLAITLTASEFDGAENICSIASWNDNGDGTLTATMDCDSQGQKTTERIAMNPVFAPTGEGITLTYLDRSNEETTVLRCPATRG